MASGERWAVGGLHLVVVGYLVASHICYYRFILKNLLAYLFTFRVRWGLCFGYFWHYAIFGQLCCSACDKLQHLHWLNDYEIG